MKQFSLFIISGIFLFVGINSFTKNFLSSTPSGDYEPLENVAVVVDTDGSYDTKVNFKWRDANGNEYSLADHRGKVILINFWATWCVPCRKEIPELVEINNEMNDEDLIIIGISVDQGKDAVQKVNNFIVQQNVNYPNILDDGRISRLFGSINALPTTILLDREGKVAETIIGLRTKEQFLGKITELL